MALKMLLVRAELTAIGFVLGVTELTLLDWLRRAALKAQELNEHLLREVRVTHVSWMKCGTLLRASVASGLKRTGKVGLRAKTDGNGFG